VRRIAVAIYTSVYGFYREQFGPGESARYTALLVCMLFALFGTTGGILLVGRAAGIERYLVGQTTLPLAVAGTITLVWLYISTGGSEGTRNVEKWINSESPTQKSWRRRVSALFFLASVILFVVGLFAVAGRAR
jgi:hypothetical protein